MEIKSSYFVMIINIKHFKGNKLKKKNTWSLVPLICQMIGANIQNE